MEHVAIDLGSVESQICVRAQDGTIVEERRCATRSLKGYLKKRPPSRVILETCTEAFGVADMVLELGHEVRVVPSTLSKVLGVGRRGLKTDRRDAQALSEASCSMELPSVHVPSLRSRELKDICTSRDTLVSMRTKTINRVRSWARSSRIRLKGRGAETFTARMRAKSELLPLHIEQLLTVLDALTEQIREADAQLEYLAKRDPVCEVLMTMPGVGPQTAIRFRAAVDERGRFTSAHELESYFGLTPGENSSSSRVQRTRLTKAGSAKVRWVLVQAAWTAMRTRPNDPMVRWALRVAERRGRQIAIVALARKMAGILHAMWRDGTVYDPSLGARATSVTGS